MNRFNYLILVVFIALLNGGCSLNKLEEVSVGASTEWALPLIDSRKSFGDLIKDFDKQSQVEIKSDGSIIMHYKGSFVARSSNDIFAKLRNALFPILDTVMKVPLTSTAGVYIDYAEVKNGKLLWLFDIKEPLEVTLIIPQLELNGAPLIRKFKADIGVYKDSLDLKGWRLVTKNDSNIVIMHDARRANGDRVNLKNLGAISLQNFEFNFVKGLLGSDAFDAPADTIPIDFFKRWQGGKVDFIDPKMTVELYNSFGVPVRAISRVTEVVTTNGNRIPLQSPLTNGIDINYPTLLEIGQTKKTTIVFDKNNSNFAEIISSNPSRVEYDIDGLTNPDLKGQKAGFLTDSSRFNFQVYVDIPLTVKAKNFLFSDTVDVNLSGYQSVQEAELKILTDNKMPVDINLQGYFVGDNYGIMDSFFIKNNLLLRGAPVDVSGLPRGAQTAENFITLDEAKFNRVRLAKKIVLKYSISTTNSGSDVVRLAATQDVQVRMGMKFKLKK
jgi:hypothetical protein